jgi:hypothetical protein
MNETAVFVIGLILGGLTTWFFVRGNMSWKAARKSVKAPAKAKEKYEGEKKKARESVTKGHKQYLWSIFYFAVGVVIVVVIMFFVRSIM